MRSILTLDSIASLIGLVKAPVTLPNGKVVDSLTWLPSHLPAVFAVVDNFRADSGAGKNDLVVISGPCPTWLLPCISHACHPTSTAVAYPQGGPDATLPLSGVMIDGAGAGQDIEFIVIENPEFTSVEFKLMKNEVDAPAILASLVAPAVTLGKPVRISGRGPVAIAAALAEAYAHRVPSVSCFQPGTGNVVAISHDAGRPMGTVEQ